MLGIAGVVLGAVALLVAIGAFRSERGVVGLATG
jgi:hypothetical protein